MKKEIVDSAKEPVDDYMEEKPEKQTKKGGNRKEKEGKPAKGGKKDAPKKK